MSEFTSTKDVVKAIFLIEFYEQLSGVTELLESKQVDKWNRHFRGRSIEDIPLIKLLPHLSLYRTSLDSILYRFYSEWVPTVFEALNLCEGKLFLYGFSSLGPLSSNDFYPINFCFVSCTTLEATNLLLKCLDLFKGEVYNMQEEGILIIHDGRELFFSFNIFSDKQQILRSVGPAPERHIWNPFCGYYTTFSGGMALSMSAFPLDVSYPTNKSHEYLDAGFGILFHGLNDDFDKENIFDERERPNNDPALISFEDFEPSTIIGSLKYFKDILRNYVSPVDWYRQEYTTCVVGIDDDKYVVLNNIKNAFKLNDDILQMLCSYLLFAEAKLSKDRLLTI